ncbi:MAG TPA: FAD-dependent oxidoreductase [Ktedonobacteraceae bacterium]|jgi:renalase|nr:FAD-dependent oxidoreductase [Ktedonobacteraceae bacterium]
MPSIAIIGAGCSGLAAAHVLQDAGYAVTLFEQHDYVGGRVATGKRDGFIYDYGAQYIKGGSPVSDSLILERFHVEDLIDIGKPVWIFESHGHIQEGDPAQNAGPKWTYRSGLSALPQRMAEGLDIRLKSRVSRIKPLATAWNLTSDEGRPFGDYDQLLLTMSTGDAGGLILSSKQDLKNDSTDWMYLVSVYLREGGYNPLLSVMLGYETRPQMRPYYALVNTDKRHPISWLAWEHEKSPERVPPGAGLLIAQMAPQYTLDHWNNEHEETVEDVHQLVVDLIGEPLDMPVFGDVQAWAPALPIRKANADTVNAIAFPHRLAFCGDGYVGGRVHLALENGIRVARQIIQGHVEEKQE